MNLAPATIKSQLYPDYQGASLLQESLGTELRTVTGLDSDDNDETEVDLDTEEIRARNRCSSIGYLLTKGEQGRCSGESIHLPPMWLRIKSQCRHNMWVEFVVGSLLCSTMFFSWCSGFPLSSKTKISEAVFSKNYAPQRCTFPGAGGGEGSGVQGMTLPLKEI